MHSPPLPCARGRSHDNHTPPSPYLCYFGQNGHLRPPDSLAGTSRCRCLLEVQLQSRASRRSPRPPLHLVGLHRAPHVDPLSLEVRQPQLDAEIWLSSSTPPGLATCCTLSLDLMEVPPHFRDEETEAQRDPVTDPTLLLENSTFRALAGGSTSFTHHMWPLRVGPAP